MDICQPMCLMDIYQLQRRLTMSNRPKILITGATSGIGLQAALSLACRGADIIFTARSKEKADQLHAAIKTTAPSASADAYFVDFADLSAVVATGRAIALANPQIDVMINNAGLHAFQQRVTKNGFAEMMAVNYLAPWLLTKALRETVIHSAPARIINVASEASRQSRGLDMDSDLIDTTPFTARGSSRIYGRTKLLNIMFSLELARQLEGTGVTVNCLCPGFNVTGLGRELFFSVPLAKLLNWLDIGNPNRGADIIVRLAIDPASAKRTGAYVRVKNAADLTPFSPANDEHARRKLWSATEALLRPFDIVASNGVGPGVQGKTSPTAEEVGS